jgi:hypothetical protein
VASTRVADDDGSDVRGAADGVEVADDGTTGTIENLKFEKKKLKS